MLPHVYIEVYQVYKAHKILYYPHKNSTNWELEVWGVKDSQLIRGRNDLNIFLWTTLYNVQSGLCSSTFTINLQQKVFVRWFEIKSLSIIAFCLESIYLPSRLNKAIKMLLFHILLISAFQKESPVLTLRKLGKRESKEGVSCLPVTGEKGSFMGAKN